MLRKNGHILNQKISWIIAVFPILFFWYFFQLQVQNPIVYDAQGYLDLAHSYHDNGFLETQTDLRTYLYPAFLSMLYKISLLTGIKEILVISIAQLVLYLFSTIILVQSILQIHQKMSKMVFLAFSMNIFIFPYIVLSLTDLMLFCFFILWLSRMILLEHAVEIKNFKCARFQILMVGFLSGLMLALRPAALWICIASIVMLFVYFRKYMARYVYQEETLSNQSISIFVKYKQLTKGYTVLLTLMLFVLPLIPQLYYNYHTFGVISPFPVYDLKALQIFWGIHLLKFGASFEKAISYISPFYKPAIHGDANILWYFKNFTNSFKHVFCKLIAAFDFAYVWIYANNNYTLHSFGSWVLGLSSLSIFNTGFWGSISYAIHNPGFLGHKFLPLILFFIWSFFTLPTAIESRFVIPILLVFLVMSIYQIQLLLASSNTYKKYFILYYVLSIALFIPIMYFVRNTAS